MEEFKKMTDKELKSAKQSAKHIKLSPYAKFCVDNREFDFIGNTGKLEKWEVFYRCYNERLGRMELEKHNVIRKKAEARDEVYK
jgi:hypothetical protein